jgi:hypothetical protein
LVDPVRGVLTDPLQHIDQIVVPDFDTFGRIFWTRSR